MITKRDIYHIFHPFGTIAQISIKQAYGFVQFMDQQACMDAIAAEQGAPVKGKRLHLEVSKPPKNSRGAGTAAGDKLRADHYRRSRSPDSRRPGSRGTGRNGDRYRNPPFSDFRDEPRRRDDYRPGRSPSPRGFRRDDYRGRDRSPGRFRTRSRSPYGRGSRYGRSPSPRRRSIDEEESLAIPRRHPRDVPDVQILLIDEIDRYERKSFFGSYRGVC
jgi:RNA recognition motif-containing protein